MKGTTFVNGNRKTWLRDARSLTKPDILGTHYKDESAIEFLRNFLCDVSEIEVHNGHITKIIHD